MPARTAAATALYGAAYGFLPIGWIVLNAVFLYNITVETGQFEILKSVGRALVVRPAHPGAARRVLVRRVHRRRVGVRHAGGDLQRAADRASASRRSMPPACRSSRTRRPSRSAPSARRFSRSAAVTELPARDARRDGRAAAAVRLAARARVARRDDERLARAARGVARRARLRRHVRDRPVRVEQLRRRRAGGHRRRPRVDRARSRRSAESGIRPKRTTTDAAAYARTAAVRAVRLRQGSGADRRFAPGCRGCF